MKALLLNSISNLNENNSPLILKDIPVPVPEDNELLIKVSACGICHTELDEIEGRTPPQIFPMVLGHQVAGRVAEKGKSVTGFNINDRIGVGWIYSSCGKCSYCMEGNDNLCEEFRATGRDVNGGYEEYMTVPEKSASCKAFKEPKLLDIDCNSSNMPPNLPSTT